MRVRITVLLAATLAACASPGRARPELPESVSPGWKLVSLDPVAPPTGIPSGSPPECWKANYSGEGTAQIWVCVYRVEAAAFDAAQRMPAEAQAVKFQEGAYFVLVKWNAAPKANLAALVRAIQTALKRK